MTDAHLPHWVEDHLVADAAFAAAYAAVPDARRALLKTALARSWEWAGPARALSGRCEELLRSGLRAVRLREPRRFAVLLFDESESSPARLLAALAPALAAGIPEILALRAGGRSKPPAPVLAALELAGVERLALLSARRSAELLRGLESWPALVRGLGGAATAGVLDGLEPHPLRAVWRATPPGPLGVWRDKAADLDLQALAFAHPGASVEVWGAGKALPAENFVKKSGTFDAFLERGYPAVWVSAQRRDACLTRSLAVFGPGCESCWHWPGLEASLCLVERLAWTWEEEPENAPRS